MGLILACNIIRCFVMADSGRCVGESWGGESGNWEGAAAEQR